MGLDTTHNAWHGPYSSFNRFRFSLAKQIGIDLDQYYGYGDGHLNLEDIAHDIQPLLNHSDCDGELSVAECQRVASGLNSILDNFLDIPADSNFKDQIKAFRDGCLLAVSKNEPILFR